jgi:GT2 family glycosyltransferase
MSETVEEEEEPNFLKQTDSSRRETDPPSVLVVILNWNGEDDTIEAIQSVQALDYPRFQILVVDNGSRPESLAAIRAAYPEVECVETGENLGYAGGNNVGFRIALDRQCDYCLVLNNDLTVDRGMLTQLIECAQAQPDLAVLGPRVYRYDAPDRLFYPGWAIDWKRWLFHTVPQTENPEEPTLEVAYVQGCALLVRSKFLADCGLFDERFHLYCEDADLSVRAQRAGWRTVEVMGARAWHKGYGSSGKNSPLKTYYGLRNRLLFIDKHAADRSFWNRLVLRGQLLTFDAGGRVCKALCDLLTGDRRSGWATLRALGRALFDWVRNHYGPGPDWLFRRPS